MPKIEIPQRLIRVMGAEVEVDVEKRILKRALFVTRNIASDGGIVVPDGISVKHYEENPVVLLMHGRTERFPVIGRSLGMQAVRAGIESATQFADTEIGRELAYLYGVNKDKEVYARGWSFGWETIEMETWTLEHAKQWLGADYDDELVPPFVKRWDEVWVALKSRMNEYSAVALGADKKALSRAFADKNVRLAGELVADLDLHEAATALKRVKTEFEVFRSETGTRIEKLESDIQALRGDGASAAAKGDSEAVRLAVLSMAEQLRARRQG